MTSASMAVLNVGYFYVVPPAEICTTDTKVSELYSTQKKLWTRKSELSSSAAAAVQEIVHGTTKILLLTLSDPSCLIPGDNKAVKFVMGVTCNKHIPGNRDCYPAQYGQIALIFLKDLNEAHGSQDGLYQTQGTQMPMFGGRGGCRPQDRNLQTRAICYQRVEVYLSTGGLLSESPYWTPTFMPRWTNKAEERWAMSACFRLKQPTVP